MFPNGRHDDFVDAAAHLGRGINQLIAPQKKYEQQFVEPVGFNITPRSIKETLKRDSRALALADR
jgi:hypothetical protein